MSELRGFVSIPTAVLRNRSLPAGTRCLFGVILTYAWGERPCTASTETLCADAGIRRSAFFEAIGRLKAAGLIEVRQGKDWRHIIPVHTASVAVPEEQFPEESGIRTEGSNTSDSEPIRSPESGYPDTEVGVSSSSLGSVLEPSERIEPYSPTSAVVRTTREQASNDAEIVFEHWKAATGRNGATRLTPERRAKIRARRQTFSVAELCRSVDLAVADPFIMGDNDRGRRYDDLTSLFLNDDRVAKRLENAALPTTPRRNGNGRTGWTAEDARRCAREMEGVIEGTAHDVV